ncbi:MAG: transglycosylase family protein [Solirubrobacterales bacterium]
MTGSTRGVRAGCNGAALMRRGLAIAGAVAAASIAVAAGAFVLNELTEGPPELQAEPLPGALGEVKQLHRRQLRSMRQDRHLLGVPRARLEAIAACESHGNPRSVSSDGSYRGKYQFDRGTWAGVGGEGDPAKATELEQDLRAAMLYRESGPGHWPNC